MLKPRLVGVVLVRRGWAVQSLAFSRYLPVGRPEIAVEYLDRWGVDEIAVLHLEGDRTGPPAPQTVAEYARRCQVPLAIGGGVRTVVEVSRLIQGGADKVVLNTAAVEAGARGLPEAELVEEAALRFGEQAVVVSVDARRRADGQHEVFTRSGRHPVEETVDVTAKRLVAKGAGELLVTSIDRDGSKQGYDLELVRRVAEAVTVPVIVCGGACSPEHFADGLRAGASAVAAANCLNFVEHSVVLLKRGLADRGVSSRIDTQATYEGRRMDAMGRLCKQSDEVLSDLRFRFVPEEVI